MNTRHILAALGALAALFLAGTRPAAAQLDESWVVFVNDDIDFRCDLINGFDSEFVVLENTGEMVLITGRDAILNRIFVDSNDLVYFNDAPAGQIELLVDADGLDAVFWTSLTGTVIGVDTFSGEPFDSGYLPTELSSGCDACLLIDESVFCEGDGGFVPLPPLPPLCGAGIPGFAAMGMMLAFSLRFAGRRRRR